MAKITYEDKEFLNKNEDIANNRKVNDTDLNEIKQVVNTNDDNIGDLSNLNTTDKSSIVGAINEIKKKNILTAEMSQEQLAFSDNRQIPLKVGQLVGSEINLANNIITISNNIKKVKVSATFNAQMPSAGNVYGQLSVKATPGGIVLATSANTSNVGQYNFFEMNVTSKIIDVSTNKKLYLNAYLSREGTAHHDEYGNCYITVEAVE